MAVSSLLRALGDEAIEGTVLLSFSRVGYAARRRLFGWPSPESFRMDGRVVLVTGGNSGLGFATARALARGGAGVRILARDRAKGERALRAIGRETGQRDLGLYVADMSDLSSVRSATEEIRGREDRLDVLIHNAGALLPRRQTSVDGFERTFATMVLGPFALTNRLVPLLERTGGARVILVSSGGMYAQGLRLDDLQSERGPYRGSVAYARAKRAQVALGEEWAERLRPRGIVVHAMHPGWAETPGLAAGLPAFRRLMRPLLRSAEEGADTIVWLAAAPEAGRSTGRFWLDRRVRSTVKVPGTGVDPPERRRLWEACEAMAARGREAA